MFQMICDCFWNLTFLTLMTYFRPSFVFKMQPVWYVLDFSALRKMYLTFGHNHWEIRPKKHTFHDCSHLTHFRALWPLPLSEHGHAHQLEMIFMILKDAYNHISIEKFPYETFHFPRNMTLFWLVDCGLAQCI